MQFARLEAGPALAGGPPLTTIYVQRFTEGAPPLRFLQGWAEMMPVL